MRDEIIPNPQGILTVTVDKARNLPSGDWTSSITNPKSFFKSPISWLKQVVPKKRSSDPFVEINVGGTSLVSEIQHGTNDPNFGFTCELPLVNASGCTLNVNIYDYDTVTENDLLGYREEDLSLILKTKSKRVNWKGLVGADKGDISMGYSWRPIRELKVTDSRRNVVDGVIAFQIVSLNIGQMSLPKITLQLVGQNVDKLQYPSTKDTWESMKSYKKSQSYKIGNLKNPDMDLFLLNGGMLRFHTPEEKLKIQVLDKFSKSRNLKDWNWSATLSMQDIFSMASLNKSKKILLNRSKINSCHFKNYFKNSMEVLSSSFSEKVLQKQSETETKFQVEIELKFKVFV